MLGSPIFQLRKKAMKSVYLSLIYVCILKQQYSIRLNFSQIIDYFMKELYILIFLFKP